MNVLAGILAAVALLAPEMSVAQAPLVTCTGVDCNLCTFVEMVNRITVWLIAILTLVAVMLMVYAGFRMVISAGNTQAVQDAKKLLINVIIGFIIVLAAYALVDTLLKALIGDTARVGQFWSPAGEACGRVFTPGDQTASFYTPVFDSSRVSASCNPSTTNFPACAAVNTSASTGASSGSDTSSTGDTTTTGDTSSGGGGTGDTGGVNSGNPLDIDIGADSLGNGQVALTIDPSATYQIFEPAMAEYEIPAGPRHGNTVTFDSAIMQNQQVLLTDQTTGDSIQMPCGLIVPPLPECS